MHYLLRASISFVRVIILFPVCVQTTVKNNTTADKKQANEKTIKAMQDKLDAANIKIKEANDKIKFDKLKATQATIINDDLSAEDWAEMTKQPDAIDLYLYKSNHTVRFCIMSRDLK